MSRGPGRVVEGLSAHLERMRDIVSGDFGEAARQALESIDAATEFETGLLAAAARPAPLTNASDLDRRHRALMQGVEVFYRDGHTEPAGGHWGPFRPLARMAVEVVARYVVRRYTKTVLRHVYGLYVHRETQLESGTADQQNVAGRREQIGRLRGEITGGGAAIPIALSLGTLLPAVLSGVRYAGAIDTGERWVWLIAAIVASLFLVPIPILVLSGARHARRRAQLLVHVPLSELWQAIGDAGAPPQDDSARFAVITISVLSLGWLVLPVFGGLLVLRFS